MNTMKVEYKSSVFTPAGWRGVTITAEAERTSLRMVEVTKVITIDGDAPIGYTSRTGAKRQQYNAVGVARREVGKRKRISSIFVVDTQEND